MWCVNISSVLKAYKQCQKCFFYAVKYDYTWMYWNL